jgi:serpin B
VLRWSFISAAIALGGCGSDASTDAIVIDEQEPGQIAAYELIQSDVERNLEPDATAAELNAFTLGNHQLTIDLHHTAARKDTNAMLSTYSIRSAFSLLYPGARGETAAEIAAVMGFDADSDRALTAINAADLTLGSRNLEADDANELEAVELHTANAFWSQTGAQWSDIYLDALAVHLGAPVYATNFAADPEASRATINGWVEDQTRERIKDLLPDGSITAGTAAVLTNAVYFKAPWATKFEKEFTRDADFRRLDGSTVSVPTMAQASHVGFVRGDGYSAAELPFRNGDLAMVFILPDEGEFRVFEDGLTAETLGDVTSALVPTLIDLKLPKFELETKASLSASLRALGLEKIFNGGDLSGMREGGGLEVSDVFHQTFITVEEGGAEAAAATAIVFRTTSVEPEPEVSFHADRPFIFGIRDVQTGLFLFFGRVVDPS